MFSNKRVLCSSDGACLRSISVPCCLHSYQYRQHDTYINGHNLLWRGKQCHVSGMQCVFGPYISHFCFRTNAVLETASVLVLTSLEETPWINADQQDQNSFGNNPLHSVGK